MVYLESLFLGQQNYEPIWLRMKEFTQERTQQTHDQLWVLEHQPVYTLGLNGSEKHILHELKAPLIKSDRGGQITWHGPGQLVAYTLLDIQRLDLGIKRCVYLLEEAVIRVLNEYGLRAKRRENAPGVYINNKKIASIGLKVRKGCSYHGISLNINNAIDPFFDINPCGYDDLQVTTLSLEGSDTNVASVSPAIASAILDVFGFTALQTNIDNPNSRSKR